MLKLLEAFANDGLAPWETRQVVYGEEPVLGEEDTFAAYGIQVIGWGLGLIIIIVGS